MKKIIVLFFVLIGIILSEGLSDFPIKEIPNPRPPEYQIFTRDSVGSAHPRYYTPTQTNTRINLLIADSLLGVLRHSDTTAFRVFSDLKYLSGTNIKTINSNSLLGSGDISVSTLIGYTPYNAANPSNYIPLTALSSTATGLTYTNTTGVFSLSSGHVIPTTTEESNWNTAYGWGNHASAGYFIKATDDLDDVIPGAINVHLTTTLKSNYDAAYSHISLTNNPHSVTAALVGLGNLTNKLQIESEDSTLTYYTPYYIESNYANKSKWGVSRGGYLFDGVNDNIIIADDDNLDFGTNNFSVEWCGIISSLSSNVTLLYKWFSTQGSYQFRVNTDGKLYFYMTDGTTTRTFNSTQSLSTNQKYHIVMTVEREGDLTFYVNGSLFYSTSILSYSSDILSNTIPCYIGYNGSVYSKIITYYERVYNKLLTQNEVIDKYNNGLYLFDIDYVDKGASQTALTSGTLIVGKRYKIDTYVAGDDFANVGGTNVTGNEFIATGTTPTTWANLSSLRHIGAVLELRGENATSSYWFDVSGNNLHGTTSGSPAVIINNTWGDGTFYNNLSVGTEDRDGTPPIGRITIKATNSNGSSNVFVGRNSSDENVLVINDKGSVSPNGAIYYNPTTADDGYVIQDTDQYVYWNSGSGTGDTYLDAGVEGQTLYLKNIDGGASWFIIPDGLETIDTYSDYELANVNQRLTIQFHGSRWEILDENPSLDGDKGDITVSSSGATYTIDADAVTYDKIQNVNTDKLLGRTTAGSGSVEEISVTDFTQSLFDDTDAATARATLGAQAAIVIAYKTTDETINNSAAYQDDDELQAIIGTGTYTVELILIGSVASATPRLKARLTGASITYRGGTAIGTDFNIHSMFCENNTDSTIVSTAWDYAGTEHTVRYNTVISCAATSDTLKVQWSQSTADASDTKVLAGSYLKLTKIN